MNNRQKERDWNIARVEDFLREHWIDVISMGLTLLTFVLMLLEYLGVINL